MVPRIPRNQRLLLRANGESDGCAAASCVDSLVMLKVKTWLVKVLPFLSRWGSNTTPNP